MAEAKTDLQTQNPSNNERKIKALKIRIQRQHEYRVQIWSQCELRLRAMQEELRVLGTDRVELFEPQFDDDNLLRHYAEMRIAK